MTLSVNATVEAPLTVPARRESGNRTIALSYVPGTTLRGALAAQWIREFGPPVVDNARQAEFIELFEGTITYGPLIPEGSSIEPVSVMRCKYPADLHCTLTAIDLADLAPGETPAATCPACQGPLEPGKGRLLTDRTLVSARTRTALTRDETADEGSLYTTEAILPGTRLVGTIEHATGTAHDWLTKVAFLSIGRRRTVGGRVKVELAPSEGHSTPVRDDGRVLIRLTSPAVLLGRWGEPVTDFNLDEVAEVLGCDVVGLGDHRSWTRVDRVSGWHAASGLPKPDEVVVTAGSTLVLQPTEAIGPEALSRLASRGLGVRRVEGFGQVEVNPGPWVPPNRSADVTPSGADQTSESGHIDELAVTLRKSLTLADRRWLISLLRQRRADPRLALAIPPRRMADLAPTVRAKVKVALGTSDDELTRLVQRLRSANGEEAQQ